MFVDTYRRQTQLNRARAAAIARNKPLLNLSCDKTAYGDVNADIVEQDVQNFVKFTPGDPLPFENKQFGACYCSHTLEHCDKPLELFMELERVSDEIFIVLPDWWQISCWDPSHVWIPVDQSGKKYIKNPFSSGKQRKFLGNPLIS